ncbi:glycosyltransferase family 4 protein, partial [candidate division KSB1 bacterium]|nr:glycosyltransferase family 4 protein [candidate division KSB1 bacterium]
VLTSLKGIDYLINGCKEVVNGFPNVVFFIVGDGPEMPVLQKLTHDSGLEDHIIFTGFRKDRDLLLSQFDLFVLPSLTESLPTTILETLALKTPVIATDVGGVGEIIKHNETGLLISAGCSSKLAEAIIILLRDRKKATELAEAGFKLVQKEHNHNRMIEQISTLYSDLVNKKK